MLEALPRRGMGVQGRWPRADLGPVLAKEDSNSCGPDAISSSTYRSAACVTYHQHIQGSYAVQHLMDSTVESSMHVCNAATSMQHSRTVNAPMQIDLFALSAGMEELTMTNFCWHMWPEEMHVVTSMVMTAVYIHRHALQLQSKTDVMCADREVMVCLAYSHRVCQSRELAC